MLTRAYEIARTCRRPRRCLRIARPLAAGFLFFYSSSVSALTEIQLTNDPADDMKPAWSHDGQWIAFVSTRSGNADIWVIAATGGDARQLTFHPAQDAAPSWSPDDTQIAFSSPRTGNDDIWVIPSSGGAERRITTHPANDFDPDWSPDGTKIAFTSWRSGSNIWIVPANGGTEIQVTFNLTDNAPAWSPDGSHIAFDSHNEVGAPTHIHVVPGSGAASRVVTSAARQNMTPAWSPDGRWIAYTSDQDFEEVQFHIWMIPSTGGQALRLTTSTTDTQSDEDPAWSPDGTRIAYESWRSGSSDIWIITNVTAAIKESTWSDIKKGYR